MADNLYPDGDLRHLVAEEGEALEGDRPIYILCPYHDDKSRPSLAVYPDHAFCFTCRHYLHRDNFLALFSERERATAFFTQSRRAHKPPKPKVDVRLAASIAHDALMDHIHGYDKIEWLQERGITTTMIEQYCIGHNGIAYSLPVWGADGALVTVRYRRDDTEAPHLDKYWGLRGANGTLLYPNVPHQERIVLTEGEFDALLLRRYGLPAYSFTNGAQSMHKSAVLRERLPGVKYVWLAFDQDGPGQESAHKLLSLLEEIDIIGTTLTWAREVGKDVTEVWQRHDGMFQQLLGAMQSHFLEEAE